MLEPSSPACETPQVTPGGRPLPAPRTDGRLLAQCCCGAGATENSVEESLVIRFGLVERPAGAPQQGDPPSHRRRRHSSLREHAEWAVGRRYMSADSLAKARLEVIQAEPIVEVRGELVAAS